MWRTFYVANFIAFKSSIWRTFYVANFIAFEALSEGHFMSLTCQWPSLTFRIAVGNFAKTSTLDRDDVFSIEGGESKTLPSGYEYVLIKGRLWCLGAIICCRWYICILSNTCVWKQTTLLCRFVCFWPVWGRITYCITICICTCSWISLLFFIVLYI